MKEKGIEPILIEEYPEIKKHLDQFYPSLKKRIDKGFTPYNLRNCAYMEDLNSQKIIWGEISDATKFCLDKQGKFLTEATTFILTGECIFYLLAFLNSTVSSVMII